KVEGSSETPPPLQERGHRQGKSRTGAQPLAFVGEKEECLVLLDRAANGAAIHVVTQLGSDSTAATVDRGEETRGIHRVVAEVFVQTPMQLIGPGLRRRH